METTIEKKNTTFYMSMPLVRELKKHAADRDERPVKVLERALREFLDRQAARKKVALTAGAR